MITGIAIKKIRIIKRSYKLEGTTANELENIMDILMPLMNFLFFYAHVRLPSGEVNKMDSSHVHIEQDPYATLSDMYSAKRILVINLAKAIPNSMVSYTIGFKRFLTLGKCVLHTRHCFKNIQSRSLRL